MLLDPHGEYARAFPDEAVVLSPDVGLRLPYWLCNFDEFAEIVFAGSPLEEQSKILGEAVVSARHAFFEKSGADRYVNVDTPTPHRMSAPGKSPLDPPGLRTPTLFCLQIDRGALTIPAGLDLIAQLLAFLEAEDAGALNCADVDKHVLRPVIRLDEAITLLRVEPLHGAVGHLPLLKCEPW